MTAIDITVGPLAEADHRSQLRRAVIASTVGTTIEWGICPIGSAASASI
jgi:hypothetical protein